MTSLWRHSKANKTIFMKRLPLVQRKENLKERGVWWHDVIMLQKKHLRILIFTWLWGKTASFEPVFQLWLNQWTNEGFTVIWFDALL